MSKHRLKPRNYRETYPGKAKSGYIDTNCPPAFKHVAEGTSAGMHFNVSGIKGRGCDRDGWACHVVKNDGQTITWCFGGMHKGHKYWQDLTQPILEVNVGSVHYKASEIPKDKSSNLVKLLILSQLFNR